MGVMPAIGSFENAPMLYRHGPDEPPVDVDGASAHPLCHAGLVQIRTLQPCQDQIAPGSNHIAENAQNLDFEFLELGAFEDRPPDAHHSGTDVLDWHQGRRGW